MNANSRWIEYHSGPDDYNRRQFTLHWMESYPKCNRHQSVLYAGKTIYPRGQVFFSDPKETFGERLRDFIEGLPPWRERNSR